METHNTKDALGNEIIPGDIYGYSVDNNGHTHSTIGEVTKFTPSGMATLDPTSSKRSLWMGEQEDNHVPQKKVSVKPGKLFPVKSKRNQDIIDFRYWLIEKMYPSDGSLGPDLIQLEVMEKILINLNLHFRGRGYDVG